MPYPDAIQKLIREFEKMPGIGSRTAERLAFHVLRAPAEDALQLALAIRDVRKNVRSCSICCAMTTADPCAICSDAGRDRSTILVVEQSHDVEAFEAAGHRGLYHVLGGVVNPVEGIEPEHLTIEKLARRLQTGEVREVILGMDPDFEGEGTAGFVAGALAGATATVTRIASGIPAGSAVGYSNAAVLAEAVAGRREMRSSR